LQDRPVQGMLCPRLQILKSMVKDQGGEKISLKRIGHVLIHPPVAKSYSHTTMLSLACAFTIK
jgi:hypothetical protein